MAKLLDGSGDAGSNLVRGAGTATATFPLPGNVPLSVESVYATVDNSAGGATTALLTIKDASGEVIARKRQGATIDAGASGSATWAFRLDDDSTSTSTKPPLFFATLTMQGPLANELGSSNVTHPADNDPTMTPQMYLGLVWTAKLNGQLELTLFNGSAAAITAIALSCFIQRLDVASREAIGGGSVVIPAGTTADIPLDTHALGGALLNLAVAPPTFNAAGIYAVSTSIGITP